MPTDLKLCTIDYGKARGEGSWSPGQPPTSLSATAARKNHPGVDRLGPFFDGHSEQKVLKKLEPTKLRRHPQRLHGLLGL